MKTVSTKLDKQDFEKFQQVCNQDGKCMSEQLRELIKMDIDSFEGVLEIEQEEYRKNIQPTQKETISIAHGKILDDFGNVIGTF